jgi:hypothetical protein
VEAAEQALQDREGRRALAAREEEGEALGVLVEPEVAPGGALGGRLAGRIRPATLRFVVVTVGLAVGLAYLLRT